MHCPLFRDLQTDFFMPLGVINVIGTRQMKTKNDYPKKTSLLHISEEFLTFQYRKDGTVRKEIRLHAGYKRIAHSYFKRSIPTEAETERAINYIEDTLEGNKELLEPNKTLLTHDQKLIKIFRKNEFLEDVHSRQSVENLFSTYAKVIMGGYSSLQRSDFTNEDFATVLVLREIMHHLKYDFLQIVSLS